MTIDEQIKLLESNAEFERKDGDLQGCLNFRQLAEWLKELKAYREAWDKVDANITARHSEATYRHFDENWFCGIHDALCIVRKLRPKDSKKEE